MAVAVSLESCSGRWPPASAAAISRSNSAASAARYGARAAATSASTGSVSSAVAIRRRVSTLAPKVKNAAASAESGPGAARAALRARAHFTDLGGNTDVVLAELAFDGEARLAGVSLVPDAGLAPGLANALVALALVRRSHAREVRVWCGGLPQHPRGPLGYKLVFHIGGLTNEYTGDAVVLRGQGIRKQQRCERQGGCKEFEAVRHGSLLSRSMLRV